MKEIFVVFWLSTERKIYGDDSYHVLGGMDGSISKRKRGKRIYRKKFASSERKCLYYHEVLC